MDRENPIKPQRPHFDKKFTDEAFAAPFALLPVSIGRNGARDYFLDDKAVVDFGSQDPMPFRKQLLVMTLVGSDGYVHMDLKGFEKRDVVACGETQPDSYYAGIYKARYQRNIGTPYVALAGLQNFDQVKRPIMKSEPEACESLKYKLFTVITCQSYSELYYGNKQIIYTEPEANQGAIQILQDFRLNGTPGYLVRVPLPMEDVMGLLYQDRGLWKFMYRTQDPPSRFAPCQ